MPVPPQPHLGETATVNGRRNRIIIHWDQTRSGENQIGDARSVRPRFRYRLSTFDTSSAVCFRSPFRTLLAGLLSRLFAALRIDHECILLRPCRLLGFGATAWENETYRRTLWAVVAINAPMFAVEIGAGLAAGSASTASRRARLPRRSLELRRQSVRGRTDIALSFHGGLRQGCDHGRVRSVDIGHLACLEVELLHARTRRRSSAAVRVAWLTLSAGGRDWMNALLLPAGLTLSGVEELAHIGRVGPPFTAIVPARSMTQEFREPSFVFDLLMQDGEREV